MNNGKTERVDRVILSVKGLKQYFSSGYGRKRVYVKAVDDVTFDIRQREIFGLVGESGCGKTTTGRTIIKLYKSNGGEVYYDGHRITVGLKELKDQLLIDLKELKAQLKGADEEETVKISAEMMVLKKNFKNAKKDNHPDRTIMRDIQMIFQDPISSLNPRMTVREIISEGLVINGLRELIIEEGYACKSLESKIKNFLRIVQAQVLKLFKKTEKAQKIMDELEEMSKREKITKNEYIDKRVYEVLDIVGLVEEHATRYPHEFSGGQRQRIGVARALVVKPKLLIADEPISALDVSIQAQVINLLNDLRKKLDLTILFIAHDLSVIKYFSDRVGVMYYGKMVELANSDALFKNPLHPYTKSLLSAVPLPDPNYEKTRVRIIYDPSVHKYTEDNQPTMQQVSEDHYLYATDEEMVDYKKEFDKNQKKA